MARVLFFAILAMCLVFMVQCVPVPDQGAPTTANPLQQLEDAIKEGFENVKKMADNIANDPTVKKITEDAAKFVVQGADAVREQASKVIPKTH